MCTLGFRANSQPCPLACETDQAVLLMAAGLARQDAAMNDDGARQRWEAAKDQHPEYVKSCLSAAATSILGQRIDQRPVPDPGDLYPCLTDPGFTPDWDSERNAPTVHPLGFTCMLRPLLDSSSISGVPLGPLLRIEVRPAKGYHSHIMTSLDAGAMGMSADEAVLCSLANLDRQTKRYVTYAEISTYVYPNEKMYHGNGLKANTNRLRLGDSSSDIILVSFEDGSCSIRMLLPR